MRRLPVYLLIDTSGSMKGEPIQAVNNGVQLVVSSLRKDPYALETAHLSIITFDKEAKCVLPLTPIDEVIVPIITTPDSGPTHTGAALQMLCEKIDQEVNFGSHEVKGDWMPIVILLTDGKPSDLQVYKEEAQKMQTRKFATIIACAAGMKAQTEPLKLLTDKVYELSTLDSATLMQFFKWVSASIGVGNRSVGATDDMELPPPPPELNIII